MSIHTIGSAIMMAVYLRYGTSIMAISTLPISSIVLEIIGVEWSPIPCIALRIIAITAGTKQSVDS